MPGFPARKGDPPNRPLDEVVDGEVAVDAKTLQVALQMLSDLGRKTGGNGS